MCRKKRGELTVFYKIPIFMSLEIPLNAYKKWGVLNECHPRVFQTITL